MITSGSLFGFLKDLLWLVGPQERGNAQKKSGFSNSLTNRGHPISGVCDTLLLCIFTGILPKLFLFHSHLCWLVCFCIDRDGDHGDISVARKTIDGVDFRFLEVFPQGTRSIVIWPFAASSFHQGVKG